MDTDRRFRAGAAGLNVDPPLGLPMMGVVRRDRGAESRLGPLEVTAVAFDDGKTRVVLCGVDTLGIQSPEVDQLRGRVAAATGAARAGILLNWNHTHHAPPGGVSVHGSFGERVMEADASTVAYVEHLHGRVVEVCRLACERLEPAWVRWGLGLADEAINRRERDPDGQVRRIGWHPEGMADITVPVLQAVREDGSAIATVVAYGAHTVTTGVEVIAYSPDYPGPLREAVRAMTGGECVFFLGAAGNIMPRIAFDDGCTEWERMGRRLAVEAVHAVADRPAWPPRLVRTGFGSGTPVGLFRRTGPDDSEPALAAVEQRVEFPLLPRPSAEEITAFRRQSEEEVQAAEAAGATEPELRMLRFHGANWARRAEADITSDAPTAAATGSIGAVRIGDGAIVTGPGEIFTEIGLAVKERSPAEVTMYAGYTNGAVSYFPIASEYPLGGYEPAYGNKTYGLPAQVDPVADRILVETGTRLVRSLFPERPLPEPDHWLASGKLPTPPTTARPARPDEESV